MNDGNAEHTKKKLEKSKTVNHLKEYKYPVNEEYNIDDNFNIINLFLSDDKKKKKEKNRNKRKKMKRSQSLHAYRNKQRKYCFHNNSEDHKISKLIDDKIDINNHRSYKKLRYMYYNEELINEEDEEKEKEEDEDKYI